MVKGGKRCSSMSNDGKWFAHSALPESGPGNRETCTSTGIMLSQVKSSLPQALNLKRFPKCKTQQESREFPHSEHDNKQALKGHISYFTQNVGLRKCAYNERQFNSHFCLCHDGGGSTIETWRNTNTVYKTDFLWEKVDNGPTTNRMFTKNHKQKSLAQATEHYMWFGRQDCRPAETH